jgi:hypothetical protein
MKYFTLCALLLSGCIHASLETNATEHHEFDLAAVPAVNVNIMVPVTFEARLSTRIATALKKAEEPSSDLVDSVELDGVVTSAALGTDTSLAGIYACQIELMSDASAVTLVDHDLAERARSSQSLDLPLQNATLADVRPVLEQVNPRLRFTLQIKPSELTAKKLITDLAIEVSADLSASL